MKKLLLFFMAVIAMSYTTISHAQIKGVYTGKLDVSTDEVDLPTIDDQNIYLHLTDENEIRLKIKDFVIDGLPIGDIVVEAIELQSNGDGRYTFEKEDKINAGPFTGIDIELEGSINEQEELNLSLEITQLGVSVKFSEGVRRDFDMEVLAGIYTGNLFISTDEVDMPAIDQDIEIIASDDNEITLKITDFSLDGLPIGTITVDDVEIEEPSTGNYTFKKEDKINAGPFTGIDIELEGSVNAQEKLNLTLEITQLGVSVRFEDGERPSSIHTVTQSDFSVYPTTTYDVLNVNGVKENSKFAIYNIAGINVKSGMISDNVINVADLSKGIYIINVDNRSIKFIKK